MWHPFIAIRRPLPYDGCLFIFRPKRHVWIIGAFGWRLIISRYGPNWWQVLNRFECWKYRFRMMTGRK